jgi:hypothetical protein
MIFLVQLNPFQIQRKGVWQMSWEEIDKLLQKLFDSHIKKHQENDNSQTVPALDPTEHFKTWLDQHIKESDDVEEFYQKRMICLYCGKRIEDDKYALMNHPEFPDNQLKQIYFHSKGRCNPRTRFLEYRRKKWLREYIYAGRYFKMKNKKEKNIFSHIKEKIFGTEKGRNG